MRRLRLAIALSLATLAVAACSADDSVSTTTASTSAASAPQIQSVDATNTGNGIVTLRVKATDPANGSLSYKWATPSGTLAGDSSAAVQWKPPTTAGTYSVQVVVTNAKGLTATGTQQFTVASDGSATAAGTLQVASTGGDGSGQFSIPSPLGVSGVSPPLVGADPNAAPVGTPSPSISLFQPVATPAPAAIPTTPPLQPLATPTPTLPPVAPPASPLPTLPPPTAQPGVPVPPPLQWHVYDPSLVPRADNLNALHFVSNTEGWIVGANSTVLYYHKTDAAAEPALVYRNTSLATGKLLTAVHFTSSTNGFVAGDNGYVARTQDGGNTWQDISIKRTQTPGNLTCMTVYNDQIVVVADNTGHVFRSDSANATDPTAVFWVSEPVKPADRPGDQAVSLTSSAGFQTDPSITYFVSDGVYRLDADNADATQVWRKILNLKAQDPNSNDLGDGQATKIAMASQNDIWVGTTTGNLLRSTDGGTTWNRLNYNKYKDREFNGNFGFLAAPAPISALSVVDGNNAFMDGASFSYDTTDGTASWRRMAAGTMTDMQINHDVTNGAASFLGWGVGPGGQVFEYRAGP